MSQSGVTFVDNGGIRICVERRGNGPRNVVFAHGWISSRRMWYEVLERLDAAAFTLHTFDFRGCGLSDRPPPEAHDLDGYASDLRAVLASMDGPYTLAGHSMGAKLAQYVAAEAPAGLQRLVLLAPGSARSVRGIEAHRNLTLASYGSRESIERFQRGAMVRELQDNVMGRLVDDALIAQHAHWIGWYDRGRSIDVSERLAFIFQPTLVIAGSGDPLAPPLRVKRDVAAPIAGAIFVALKGAGHNLPVETPEEVAAAIRRFAA